MNPPPSSDVEVPPGSTEPADPRALTLHLEVCRMQTELEVLERRIAQYERAEATGVGPHDPFAERAEDLVQRMVDALYAIGRSEIAESTDAARATAVEVVAGSRQRAQEILVAARAELAEALTERAEAHDVVDLTRDDTDEPVVVVAEAVGSSTISVPVDEPDVDAVEPPLAVAEPVEAVEADAVEIDVVEIEPLVAEIEVVEIDAVLVESVEVEAVEDAGPGTSLLLPPSFEVQVADTQPWPPPSAPTAAPTSPPPLSPAAQVETQRTDDAFDAWLAVAPPTPTAIESAESTESLAHDDESSRPRWVRPLQAAAALLVVVVLLVLALLALL